MQSNFSEELDKAFYEKKKQLRKEFKEKGSTVVYEMFNGPICQYVWQLVRETLTPLLSPQYLGPTVYKHIAVFEDVFKQFDHLVKVDLPLARKIKKLLIELIGHECPSIISNCTKTNEIISALLPENAGDFLFALRPSLPGNNSFTNGVFPWHQDFEYYGNMAFWVPLQECTPHNGGLQIIPNISTYFPHKKISEQSGAYYIPFAYLSTFKSETFCLNQGDAICFNSKTPHSTNVNKSGKTRWAFVLWVK
ncbi:MAG: hypothetical protein A3F41_02375 [Coxiella sp. RIFCSPHIGHO2_12_FULL_44_14]|nr:MAG: hypothetical protein A3F41_02375 [Coxiella sp. RIFCSPHIGHO2_12_FULL_44_14]